MTVEIRGRGDAWRVSYPSEANLKSPVPVYDKEGVYKETIHCAGGSNQPMTESSFVGCKDSAVEYAEYLLPGCQVTVTRTLSKSESLARARSVSAKTRQARRTID